MLNQTIVNVLKGVTLNFHFTCKKNISMYKEGEFCCILFPLLHIVGLSHLAESLGKGWRGS